jgi:hypothetical protein
MSHNYLFDFYTYIDTRLNTATVKQAIRGAAEERQAYAKGRRDALAALQEYLDGHLHCKLPRRLQKKATAYIAVSKSKN